MSAPAGEVEQLEPLVRRLLAPNPSAFTYTGTQSFIVGRGDVAIIDPGPDIPAHVDRLLQATSGERIVAIICTHTHRDHSPASRMLAAASAAPIVGCAPLAIADTGEDEAFDLAYAPDRVLGEGERVSGPDWTLEAIATPGHTSNHICLALPETRALFSGDHVMGWSTSIVSPPDGDMGDYMASLDKLLGRDDRIYYPAHGDAVEGDPQRWVRSLLGHRRQREGQILRSLEPGPKAVGALVLEMYKGVDPRLHPAAARSVLAHLLDLQKRGRVCAQGEEWALSYSA